MATYIILNLVFLLIVIVVSVILRTRLTRSWWIALGVLLLLTAIFDNLIVGFHIVEYDSAKILEFRIGVAPIEDFFYSVAAMILVPALWGIKK